jgi:hypothetical protein
VKQELRLAYHRYFRDELWEVNEHVISILTASDLGGIILPGDGGGGGVFGPLVLGTFSKIEVRKDHCGRISCTIVGVNASQHLPRLTWAMDTAFATSRLMDLTLSEMTCPNESKMDFLERFRGFLAFLSHYISVSDIKYNKIRTSQSFLQSRCHLAGRQSIGRRPVCDCQGQGTG